MCFGRFVRSTPPCIATTHGSTPLSRPTRPCTTATRRTTTSPRRRPSPPRALPLPAEPNLHPRAQMAEAFLGATHFERNLAFDFDLGAPSYTLHTRTEASLADDRETGLAQ